jgi:tripartite-type tricarboxylate transporter receptor subunit TctC
MARPVADKLATAMGQPFLVENRPGAGGTIGVAQLAKSPPDGYTLAVVSTGHVVNPVLYANLQYDTLKDVTGVAPIAGQPCVLVVSPQLGVKTVKDLVAMAKANPGKLNFGSGGVGSSQHLFGVMFNTAAGINTVHVPYKGTAPAENGLVAGEIDYMVDPPTALPFVEAGRLKALAVASPSRSPALPNVPTLDEVGIPNVHTSTWYGILAPAGTPKPIVDRLNKEIVAVLKTPELQARMQKIAAQSRDWTPEQFTKFAKEELERYKEVVRASGAKQVD